MDASDPRIAPLLGPHDPPPFEIVNGDGAAPVIFVCDHASNAVPGALGDLGIGADELIRHIGWDIGAARVTRLLARRFDAAAVLCGYSRLVIDCNRKPGHETWIATESDGTAVPGNLDLSSDEIGRRESEIFRPYHAAISRVVAPRRADGGAPAFVAIHSFTPEMDGVPRPWQVSVLWGEDPRLAVPLIERLRTDPSLTVGDNEPYSGRQHYGYTIEAHAGAAGLANVLIEIREDQIRDEAGGERFARIVGDALEDVLDDPNLRRVEHF